MDGSSGVSEHIADFAVFSEHRKRDIINSINNIIAYKSNENQPTLYDVPEGLQFSYDTKISYSILCYNLPAWKKHALEEELFEAAKKYPWLNYNLDLTYDKQKGERVVLKKEDILPTRKEKADTPLKQGKNGGLVYNILDGENRIGANLIEIAYEGNELLIECGRELEPTPEGIKLRERAAEKHYRACIVTHYHGDHAGLLGVPVNCNKIYMGKWTLNILEKSGHICEENAAKVVTVEAGRPIFEGGIKITPYLCDHSAYDSYMFLFEAGEDSLLYTGDFRATGRKSFEKLLNVLPEKVTTLLCEGTNLRQIKKPLTEKALEDILTKDFEGDGAIFVLQSATNIDRIVTVYNAAKRTGRRLIMRYAQAEVCFGLPHIPAPVNDWKCDTYIDFKPSDEEHRKISAKYSGHFVGKAQIAKRRRYVLEVSAKDLNYIKSLNELSSLKGGKLIYSTWSGYCSDEGMKAFLTGVEELGIEIVYDRHASGHADRRAVAELVRRVNPTEFKLVHTDIKN